MLVDPFMGCVLNMFDKLTNLDFGQTAKILLANKDEIIRYLKENEWTKTEMVGHSWFSN